MRASSTFYIAMALVHMHGTGQGAGLRRSAALTKFCHPRDMTSENRFNAYMIVVPSEKTNHCNNHGTQRIVFNNDEMFFFYQLREKDGVRGSKAPQSPRDILK